MSIQIDLCLVRGAIIMGHCGMLARYSLSNDTIIDGQV